MLENCARRAARACARTWRDLEDVETAPGRLGGGGGGTSTSVDITSDTAGSYDNTSGDLTSSLGNSGAASDTLTATEDSFSVPAATGTGTITRGISGGGTSCTIDVATATTAAAVVASGRRGSTSRTPCSTSGSRTAPRAARSPSRLPTAGLGDDDLMANGTIEDPGGPGVGTAVPVMPGWMLVVLALVLLAATRLALGRWAPRGGQR